MCGARRDSISVEFVERVVRGRVDLRGEFFGAAGSQFDIRERAAGLRDFLGDLRLNVGEVRARFGGGLREGTAPVIELFRHALLGAADDFGGPLRKLLNDCSTIFFTLESRED
jgi:hypothetical protein